LELSSEADDNKYSPNHATSSEISSGFRRFAFSNNLPADSMRPAYTEGRASLNAPTFYPDI
jgi:hypothetical protein